RRTRRARFFLAGAAVTLAVVGGASFALWPKGATETADAPSAASAALDLGGSLQHGAVLAAMNNHVTSGPLTDKGALRACLRGADADRALLGAMNVVYRNKQAVLVLVAGGAPGKITALVLPADCGPDNPTPLSRAEF
ncbi:MAG: hypothetical protein HOQ24_04655, partial [Mycobacteriaceae bacterium]|nr:hypothetical protein [Mycobacteriaceae bacterium]